MAGMLHAIPIEINCPDCAGLPAWLQLILVLVGLGLAYGLVYLAYRLTRRVRDPRRRARLYVGVMLLLAVGFVLFARLLVLILPD